MKLFIRMLLATIVSVSLGTCCSAEALRVAVQKTGTFAWELAVIRAHGLDTEANLSVEVLELASPEAGKIALRAGNADIVVTDWLWVSRERGLGAKLTFYPYSSALGAVMVPASSPIQTLADLRGRKLAVAGGPIDKSWLLLQALARRGGVDLKKEATIVYGAPPLLSEKALQGETDATLTFWNFCADLESKGHKRAVEMATVMHGLGAKGPVAIVGYTFDSAFAARNRSAVDRFLDAARQAKEILATSESEWQRLAPRIRVTEPNALAIYRKRYAEGIVRRPLAEEEADARGLYRVLAEIGGAELVGPARELAPGTFYRPAAE